MSTPPPITDWCLIAGTWMGWIIGLFTGILWESLKEKKQLVLQDCFGHVGLLSLCILGCLFIFGLRLKRINYVHDAEEQDGSLEAA